MNRRLTAALAFTIGMIMLGAACGGDGGGSKSSPDKSKETAPPTTEASATAGREVFVSNCARCHGQNAEGGFGPQLAGGAVVQKYPNAADQIAYVQGHSLPPFRDRLTPEQIRDVVEYTRSAK